MPARLKSAAKRVVRFIRGVARPAGGPHFEVPEADRLRTELATIPGWFHSIDLGHGIVTPGTKSPEQLQHELGVLQIPDLRGKSVLDIGAWDGFFSFEAERRGAKRIVALDHYIWSIDPHVYGRYVKQCKREGKVFQEATEVPEAWQPGKLPGKRGFDFARRALKSKVEPVVGNFMEMDLAKIGTFDVVFYLGVLYHMRHPLLALQRLASVTREVAVIETHAVYVPACEQHALCEFYETTELNGDASNWWAPNRKGLEGLCRAAGFRKVENVSPPASTATEGEVIHTRLHAHAYR